MADYSIIAVTNGYHICKEGLNNYQLVIFVETYDQAMDMVIRLAQSQAQIGE